MNRRNFLAVVGTVVGLSPLKPWEKVWPLKVVQPVAPVVASSGNTLLTIDQITKASLEVLKKNLSFDKVFQRRRLNGA